MIKTKYDNILNNVVKLNKKNIAEICRNSKFLNKNGNRNWYQIAVDFENGRVFYDEHCNDNSYCIYDDDEIETIMYINQYVTNNQLIDLIFNKIKEKQQKEIYDSEYENKIKKEMRLNYEI